MKIVGIDPGKSGAVCCVDYNPGGLNPHGITQLEILRCPLVKLKKKDESDLWGMQNIIYHWRPIMGYIEKAQPMPEQGIVSTSQYVGNWYAWLMACVCWGVPYHIVGPRTWKKIMLRDMPKDKGASIIRAKQLWPNINLVPEGGRKENHNFAEAFLIAMYGLWQEQKKIQDSPAE